jgi:hypothetical protein
MPYELSEAQEIAIAKVSNVDSFTVEHFRVYPGAGTIRIRWTLGKKNVDGTEEPITRHEKEFDVSSYASQSPDGSKTWYANLKAIVYKILLDNGELPSGGTVA